MIKVEFCFFTGDFSFPNQKRISNYKNGRGRIKVEAGSTHFILDGEIDEVGIHQYSVWRP